MQIESGGYDFDEIEEIKIPTHHGYKLIFKGGESVLFTTYLDAMYWEKLREFAPSFIFDENWDKRTCN